MNSFDALTADIARVQQIPIIPTILDVICKTTGMGFAAVARVTEDRWIACSVRDEIQFGLKPGGELKIETTICNEIRQSKKGVIIDHVEKDEVYKDHHTPKMYGFQSYISIPIFLKSGEFFGTLCAIDPRPAQLKNDKIIGMFNMFVDLISFHLQSAKLMEDSSQSLHQMSQLLTDSRDENRQLRHVSNHTLQEPLRKIRLFSSMLTDTVEQNNKNKTKDLAIKINAYAEKISMMIHDLSTFSELNYNASFEITNLNEIISEVCSQLSGEAERKNAIINMKPLPTITVIPTQMGQLFYHLISNAIKFSRKDTPPFIQVYSTPLAQERASEMSLTEGISYVEFHIEDNGIGIEKSQLEKIFDIFTRVDTEITPGGYGLGLAYCRRIIRNHHGVIKAESKLGVGTSFTFILPCIQQEYESIEVDLSAISN